MFTVCCMLANLSVFRLSPWKEIKIIIFLGGSGKKRREVVTKLKHEEYKAGVIPVEWEGIILEILSFLL